MMINMCACACCQHKHRYLRLFCNTNWPRLEREEMQKAHLSCYLVHVVNAVVHNRHPAYATVSVRYEYASTRYRSFVYFLRSTLMLKFPHLPSLLLCFVSTPNPWLVLRSYATSIQHLFVCFFRILFTCACSHLLAQLIRILVAFFHSFIFV